MARLIMIGLALVACEGPGFEGLPHLCAGEVWCEPAEHCVLDADDEPACVDEIPPGAHRL